MSLASYRAAPPRDGGFPPSRRKVIQTGKTTDGTGVSAVPLRTDNRSRNVEIEAPTGIARISDAFRRPTP